MDWNDCPESNGIGVRNRPDWVSGLPRNTHNNDTDFVTRDKLLEKAYADLKSNDDTKIESSLKTIEKYPTHDGLRNLITFWEKDIDIKIEKQILSTLKIFEEFRSSDELISEIYSRNYKPNMSSEQKQKLIRFLEASSAHICADFIKQLKSN
jgi:hypothetical protein